MATPDPERHPEGLVTMRLTITSEEQAEQVTAATRSAQALVRHYLPLLLFVACAAIIPYFIPSGALNSLPPVLVVGYYSLLAFIAGWFGINWILRTARLVVRASRSYSGDLDEEARRKVLEPSSAVSLRLPSSLPPPTTG
ncbi:MAG TPA: hypothetical protein VGV13_06915 [Methylomirabilota bacterium]|jgi:hypothetical protein|nr:hypothetical protein [Methylomirabilota bacterium]